MPVEVTEVLLEKRILKVLLADDSRVIRLVFTHLIEKCGHEVVAVVNGSDAYSEFIQEPFDIILMDVCMPEMDGCAATAKIREKEMETGGHIPILAITAVFSPADMESCLNAGMDGFLPKNCSLEELSSTIEHYASGKGAA